MNVRTELFLIPVTIINGTLHVLMNKSTGSGSTLSLPSALLRPDTFQRGTLEHVLRELLVRTPQSDLESWLRSPRCRDRIVDVFDRDLLFDGVQSVTIVRCIALPTELANDAAGTWLPASSLFNENSPCGGDCRLFLRECLNLVPQWVRHSTFVFELLPAVFSIQELREMVGQLASQDIDPGNFHRRLKRLNILSPLGTGQRIHKWEFTWTSVDALRTEGLIPS